MNHHRCLNLVLLGLVVLLPGTCHAQWYQGPSGGSGGSAFDLWTKSNTSSNFKQVIIFYDATVRCIKIVRPGIESPDEVYDPGNGGCHSGGYKEARLTLDPDEFLIGIAGRYGTYIDSIRFYTSKKNSPVYGGSGGTAEFGYTASPGQKIGGFIGRAGDNLDAIGVIYVSVQ
jgi:hypothetical protein